MVDSRPQIADADPGLIGRARLYRGIGLGWTWMSKLGVVWFLVLLVVVARIVYPSFTQGGNLQNILYQNAPIGLIAVGMTFAMISGGFDLSVGGIVALSSVTCAKLARSPGAVGGRRHRAAARSRPGPGERSTGHQARHQPVHRDPRDGVDLLRRGVPALRLTADRGGQARIPLDRAGLAVGAPGLHLDDGAGLRRRARTGRDRVRAPYLRGRRQQGGGQARLDPGSTRSRSPPT